MEKSKTDEQEPNHPSKVDHEPKTDDEFPQSIPAVTKMSKWIGVSFHHYNGFWCPATLIPAVKNFQKHFQAMDSDIILATMPKSGTTWLKALTFSIINRNLYQIPHQSPLLTTNPHTLVPFFEYDLFSDSKLELDHSLVDSRVQPYVPSAPVQSGSASQFREHTAFDTHPLVLDYSLETSRRIFATHIHCKSLPESILDSKCRIIYICRNPLDQFVSHWNFVLENFYDATTMKPPDINEALESFCQGIHAFGPFWEHMLGYWNASLNNPQKVLFLKYEDLKADSISIVKKIAEFLSKPFSEEEENNGLVEEIVKLCSFESLKNLEVNKNGETHYGVKHSSFFRKGENGDWVNYVSSSMAERLEKVMVEKIGGSGIVFEPYCDSNNFKI